MEIVLDTSALQHLLNSCATSRLTRGQVTIDEIYTSIDKPIADGKLKLAMDRDGGLEGDWSETCGNEIVKSLIIRWDSFAAVNLVMPLNSLDYPISKKLRQFKFRDAVDKLILRIAIKTSDPTVATEDPDFWSPTDKSLKGNPNACVAKLCQDSLGITILLRPTLLRLLRKPIKC
jgi:hypothetical protein